MVTIASTTMFGLLGLVFDVGYGYYLKQVAQGAADAGAMAAIAASNSSSCSATVLCQSSYSCPSSATSDTNFGTACQYAAQNGFAITANQTVTVSGGTGSPASVSGLTNAKYWVTVEAARTLPTSFLTLLNASSMNVRATATAAMIGKGDSVCVYVMDPSASKAMTVTGGASMSSGCGVYVNSTSNNALSVSGGATLVSTAVSVVGSTSISNNSSVTPTPTNGAATMTDPLAALPAPSYSGCDKTNFSISGGSVTLSPGVYCDGITISGGTVTLQPGVYVLNGGGLNISSQGATLNGSGVMFYNTASGYTYSPITVSGGASVTLSAPTSGTYQGILFFQDRTITSTSPSATNTITGNVNISLSGTIYMPTGPLVFTGGSENAPATVAIVADTLTTTGNSYLAFDSTGKKTGIGKVNAALVQ